MILDRFINKSFFSDYESQLSRCQSYRHNTLVKWKQGTGLYWWEINKVLKNLHIFDAQKIREILKKIVEDNEELFKRENLFITSFGSEGKSGGKISYEFRHSGLISQKKFIESWNLIDLPPKSTVIFVEDLIGTGSQSTEYIQNKLNLILNPSYEAYLLTICATPIGIEKVKSETAFNVINGILLDEENYQNYHENCSNFTKKEKDKLIKLNNKLKNIRNNQLDYDIGLLVTFFYSPPNNSMPILWKDGFSYENKKWFALIPRQY